MQRNRVMLCAAAVVAGTLTTLPPTLAANPTSSTPLFNGMGTHTRKVSTSSPEAQRYFNQGLVWTFAFNHDEAIRSFQTAADLDPECLMPRWGIALCNGPHINNPLMPEERNLAAWNALQQALKLAPNGTELERELVSALAHRYADPAPPDRRPLDEAYAAAMADVWKRHPKDADVGTLYAESLMDLQPWDLWAPDGSPKGNTLKILATLERVLELDPDHPGANHLYVHAVEASPHPEKGNASAERLRNAVPASGHLTHMPSHIDVQVGRWSHAADQNIQAVKADARYKQISPKQGFYRVYMAHNHHFLAFASMMEGRYQVALDAAREMVAGVPADYIETDGQWIDPWMMVVFDVHKRFGKWDALLAEPKPSEKLPITTAMWHFSRGVAYAAKGQVEPALQEQKAFRAAVKRIPSDAVMGINPAHTVLSIAEHMLSGEIAYARKEIDKAVADLSRAVEIEDSLLYMEPPEWIQPVRHALGAVLTDAGRYAEAEKVYRKDLEIWPENGWSLHGLAKCLKAQGKTAEAGLVDKRFAKTWHRADTQIETSCLCVPGRK